MKFVIRAYKSYSESAHALADKLGCKVLRDRGSTFRYNPRRHKVINWGGSLPSHGIPSGDFINISNNVAVAVNKLHFFELADTFENVPIPPYTTNKQVAQEWLNDGKKVCARASLTGNSGAGLIILRMGDQLPDVPLYVKYIPKTDEYRIHVVKVGDDYHVRPVKKKLKHDAPVDRNKLIRNHENGYIFSADVGNVPLCVNVAAINAIKAMQLDFGAVDIGYNSKTGTCIVYEVNTAPGIEGSTVDWYAEQFRKLV